jgi:hypothetical protein
MYHCNLVYTMCNSFDWFYESPFHSMHKLGVFLGSNPKLSYIFRILKMSFLTKIPID